MKHCNGVMYTIKTGDTLYALSQRYRVPLALLLQANPYVDVYNLQPGETVCIPVRRNDKFCDSPYHRNCPGSEEDMSRSSCRLLDSMPVRGTSVEEEETAAGTWAEGDVSGMQSTESHSEGDVSGMQSTESRSEGDVSGMQSTESRSEDNEGDMQGTKNRSVDNGGDAQGTKDRSVDNGGDMQGMEGSLDSDVSGTQNGEQIPAAFGRGNAGMVGMAGDDEMSELRWRPGQGEYITRRGDTLERILGVREIPLQAGVRMRFIR